MDDYDGQSLEVARQVKTGLFMIRIDYLDPETYREFAEPVSRLLETPPPPEPALAMHAQSEDSDDDSGRCGFVNTKPLRPNPTKKCKPIQSFVLAGY